MEALKDEAVDPYEDNEIVVHKDENIIDLEVVVTNIAKAIAVVHQKDHKAFAEEDYNVSIETKMEAGMATSTEKTKDVEDGNIVLADSNEPVNDAEVNDESNEDVIDSLELDEPYFLVVIQEHLNKNIPTKREIVEDLKRDEQGVGKPIKIINLLVFEQDVTD